MSSEIAFLFDLLELYRGRKRLIDRRLGLRPSHLGECRIRDFCFDIHGALSHANLCKLAFVFANVVGSRLPEHIHNRMVLEGSNEWAAEYIRYAHGLRPSIFGFNFNPNNFNNHTLGVDGSTHRMILK